MIFFEVKSFTVKIRVSSLNLTSMLTYGNSFKISVSKGVLGIIHKGKFYIPEVLTRFNLCFLQLVTFYEFKRLVASSLKGIFEFQKKLTGRRN